LLKVRFEPVSDWEADMPAGPSRAMRRRYGSLRRSALQPGSALA